MTLELIAIPNGLAGCKRKIEFDRCHWERRDGRKDKGGERLVAQVRHGRWAYWDTYPICRWNADVGERHVFHRKEGRKGGREKREGTIWHDGKSNQSRQKPRLHGGQGEITCIWRQLSLRSIRFRSAITHAPRASQIGDQSFPLKPKRDLLAVIALR